MEVQFRTIAMDFWASLEHKLQYKKNIPESQAKFLKDELYDCAQQSAALDKRMQNIRNIIAKSESEEEKVDFCLRFCAMRKIENGLEKQTTFIVWAGYHKRVSQRDIKNKNKG